MDKIKYCLFTKKDISSTISCVVKVFLHDEPMTKILGISESEFGVFAEAICKKVVQEKMSYICKNNAGEVVGFCLNEDLITEPLIGSEKITSKMDPIFLLLGNLDKNYLKNKKLLKGKFFHLFMAGILKEYREKGFIKKLISKSLVLAKKRKFLFAVAEATSVSSQNLLKNNFNFKESKKIVYKKFKFKNKFPFKILGEGSCKLIELKLSN